MARSAAQPATRQPSTRDRALAAALELFDSQGVAATTIEQLRDASGISTGSLYHHFGSREGLIAALYEDLLQHYRAVLAPALAGCGGPRPLLDTFVATHIGWAVTHPAATRFLAEHRRNPAVTGTAETRLQRGTADFLRPLLAQLKPAMDAGLLRPLPPELLLSQVLGPVQTWLKLWLDGHSSLKPDAAVRQLADLIWAAVAMPDAPQPSPSARSST